MAISRNSSCRAALWLAALFPLLGAARGLPGPGIVITNLPAYGSTDDLAGVVLHTNPAACAVVVFIYVPEAGGWWSKPTCPGRPLTPVNADGRWKADITTGGADANATRVAALLVNTNYSQPCLLGSPGLPTNVLAQAIATAITTRPSPGVRWIDFSGYRWWVKVSSGTDPVGPGPNYFSASETNVWTDAQGWLHLRITHRSNQWQCAEMVSARSFGYGDYRFELGTAVDSLDANVVLGLFTWSDDPAFSYREIDVEGARWGAPSDTNNTQFVVQPYLPAGHLVRYRTPPGLAHSTHLFGWESARIDFQAQAEGYSPNPAPAAVISSWAFTNAAGVPQPGDENVRLNLWLVSGKPPLNNNETEVIIRSFQFVPPGPPQPVLFTNVSASPGGPCRFFITSEPDRRYDIQTATDLVDWHSLATVLATNATVEFADTNATVSRRFYRAVTLP